MCRSSFAAILAFFASYTATAADCNCRKFPFQPDPPCFDQCCAKMISALDSEELVSILGLEPDLAQKIKAATLGPVFSVGPAELLDYAKFLSPKEFKTLSTRLRSLSQEDFQRIQEATTTEGHKFPGRIPR